MKHIQPTLAETLDFPYSSGRLRIAPTNRRLAHNGKWHSAPLPKGYEFPYVGWLMSEKYDGVRVLWNGTDLRSRNGNIFHAPKWFHDSLPKSMGLDGELFGGPHSFAQTSGAVRRKIPDEKEWSSISFMAFDILDLTRPYDERYEILQALVEKAHKKGYHWIHLVKQVPITSTVQMYSFYQQVLRRGGEGIMIRNPKSFYEQRRSKNLIKFKPINDQEAVVVGYTEGKGSNSGMLGSFRVEMIDHETGKPTQKYFQLSGHMSRTFRSQYKFRHGQVVDAPKNDKQVPIIGTRVTYEYMSLTKDGLPRQPIFLRIRGRE